jgi:Zincin-like metallopeptidase
MSIVIEANRQAFEVLAAGALWYAGVRATIVHEVGHHFGIDDERLHELGR